MAKQITINTADPRERWRVEGNPPEPPQFLNTCKYFTVVGHTTHIRQAASIYTEGCLTANLVSDQSTLRTERIQVVFVSPNEWNTGYRYGNIRFDYDWATLWAGKRAYWVETAEYQIHAPRILITTRDLSGSNFWANRAYNPTVRGGPWWHDLDTNRHYFNNKYCLEFMIEEDLSLSNSQRCFAVGHHRQFCRLHRDNPQQCEDLGKGSQYAASRFIAGLVAERVNNSLKLLLMGDPPAPSSFLQKCWACLDDDLRQFPQDENGTLKAESGIGRAVARSVLNAFAKGWTEEQLSLVSLFETREELVTACRTITEELFQNHGAITLPSTAVQLEVARNLP